MKRSLSFRIATRKFRDQYARYVSLREWLIHHGCEQDGEFLTETDDDPILLHLETGEQLDAELLERFEAAAQTYSNEIGWPLPTTGKQKLFDGKTGRTLRCACTGRDRADAQVAPPGGG